MEWEKEVRLRIYLSIPGTFHRNRCKAFPYHLVDFNRTKTQVPYKWLTLYGCSCNSVKISSKIFTQFSSSKEHHMARAGTTTKWNHSYLNNCVEYSMNNIFESLYFCTIFACENSSQERQKMIFFNWIANRASAERK